MFSGWRPKFKDKRTSITTNGSPVEKPYDTHISIRLVRAPNSKSGGREFKSPMWQELGALTKSRKILGVRSFYSGDPDVIT
jgi:hypothetical protein